MMKKKILQDAIAVAIKAFPVPSFTDEAAATQWVLGLVPGGMAVLFDVIHSDPARALKCLAESPEVTEAEVEEAYAACCANAGKLGDGTVLAWLKTLPWSTIISIIIGLIPK